MQRPKKVHNTHTPSLSLPLSLSVSHPCVCTVEKSYIEAEQAYEKAKDVDSVIRLNLQFLDNPQKAFSLVRTTRSAEGAAMVAKHCIVRSLSLYLACVLVCVFVCVADCVCCV